MDSDRKRKAQQAACNHMPTIGEHEAIECDCCGLLLLDRGTADPATYRAAWLEVHRRLSQGFEVRPR